MKNKIIILLYADKMYMVTGKSSFVEINEKLF